MSINVLGRKLTPLTPGGTVNTAQRANVPALLTPPLANSVTMIFSKITSLAGRTPS